MPDVWHLNRIHLVEPVDSLDAGDLAALADRWLDGVPHRRVTFDDVAGAQALWPELERRGWRRERSVVMALDEDAPRAPRDPRVTELDDPALRALQTRALADDAAVTAISAALPARLALAQSSLRAGTDWRALAIAPADRAAAPGAPGAAVSSATVYLDSDVHGARIAVIDQVATLRGFRERGLARAVVAAAVEVADAWGADTIGLFADAEDWPQVFYAGMGFATVGGQWVVHRDAGSPEASEPSPA